MRIGAALCALFLVLLSPEMAAAAIAEVQFPASGTSTTAACSTASATWTGGNTIIVVAAIRTTTSTVSSITQSAGSNAYAIVSSVNNGTNVRVELWQVTNITGGTFSITVNLSASSKQSCSAAEYSGVAAIGVNNFTTPTTPTISLTTQDANNWCVAGFAGQGTGTYAASVGRLRGTSVTSGGGAASNVGGAQGDNGPIASPGTCTVTMTNTDTLFGAGLVELRSVVPSGPPPQRSTVGVGT